MKKILFVACLMASASFMSCGNNTDANVIENDSVVIDSLVVDSIAVDSLVVDSLK